MLWLTVGNLLIIYSRISDSIVELLHKPVLFNECYCISLSCKTNDMVII
jgi:hypothetical protein